MFVLTGRSTNNTFFIFSFNNIREKFAVTFWERKQLESSLGY